jgi:Rod binding domain-containing protein
VSVQASVGSTLPGTTGLPVVNQALEPASVRHGSAAAQKAYQSALAFEQVLVEQLSKSMTAASGLGGEESEEAGSEEGGSTSSGAAAAGLSSMLPQALSSGVMDAGGLGLAAQMAQQAQLGERSTQAGAGATSVSPATGGTST